MTHSQSAQVGHSEHEHDGNSKLPFPVRRAVTVQTFELGEALEIVNRDRATNEHAILYRPSLPIRYVDRETFEKMR